MWYNDKSKGGKNQPWLVSGFYTIIIIDISSFYVVSLYWYNAVHTLATSLCYLVVVLGFGYPVYIPLRSATYI